MERAEIRHIKDYPGDLEDELNLHVYSGQPTLGDLNRLYEIIFRLRNQFVEVPKIKQKSKVCNGRADRWTMTTWMKGKNKGTIEQVKSQRAKV